MVTATARTIAATLALLLGVSVGSACGAPGNEGLDRAGGGTGDTVRSESNGGSGDGGGGAPGLPSGGGGEAPGAPISIPSIVQDQGRPLDEVLPEMETRVRDQCGGQLCLEFQVVQREPSFTQCTFVATEPPQDTEVARGRTVIVVVGTQPCDGPSEEPGGEPSEEPTEEPTAQSTEEPTAEPSDDAITE